MRRTAALLAVVVALTVATAAPASAHWLDTSCVSQLNRESAYMHVNTEQADPRWPYLVQTAGATGDLAGVSHEWPNAYMDRAEIRLYRPDGSLYASWATVDYTIVNVRYLPGWRLSAYFHWQITFSPDRYCTTPAVTM